MKPPKRFVTAWKAAQLLGVDRNSVVAWVKTGFLKGRITEKKIVRRIIEVDTLSFPRKLWQAKCVWCGKLFPTKRPTGAKFCTQKHADLYRGHNLTPLPRGGKKA